MEFDVITSNDERFGLVFERVIRPANIAKGVFEAEKDEQSGAVTLSADQVADDYLQRLKKSLSPNDKLEMVVAREGNQILGASLVAVYADDLGQPRFARQIYEGAHHSIPEFITDHHLKDSKVDRADVELLLRDEMGRRDYPVFGEIERVHFNNKMNAGALREAGVQEIKFPYRLWQDDWVLTAQGDAEKIKETLPDFITAHIRGLAGSRASIEELTTPIHQGGHGYDDYQPFLEHARNKTVTLSESPSHTQKQGVHNKLISSDMIQTR